MIELGEGAGKQIARIAGEDFVAAVARKRDGDVFTRQLGEQSGWNLGRIPEGLVVDFGQSGDHVAGLRWRDPKLGVLEQVVDRYINEKESS